MNKIALAALSFVFVVASPASAQTETFHTSLGYGSSNAVEVQKLQNFLISQGLLQGSATGNYLSLTQQAVAAFQARHGITPSSGYFGPITREAANKAIGTKSSAPTASITAQGVSSTATGAAAALSNTKVVTWQTSAFPSDAGVNINLLKRTSSKPVSYSLVRSIAKNSPNDGQEVWALRVGEKGDLYIEVTCATTLVQGCQSNIVKAN